MAKAVEFQIKIKSNDGGVFQQLTVEAEGLDKVLDEVGATAVSTGNHLREMAEKSLVLDAAVRSIRELGDMVNGLAGPFESFETAMRSANTMAGKSGAEFDALTQQVVELSKNIPLAREELANGLYQVISNGVPEDNWIEFLNKSSRSAVGGIADLGETVTVTSTLIKNYGLEWDQAGNIQDKIQMTAKNGVTSFEQLAQALPRVSGSASQLGVSMDESQRVSIQKLIGSYEDYEKRIRKSDVTLGKSWSTVKGVGNGVSTLTDALQGNRDAWSTITGVVDAAIQIYEGINGIISIIQTLTAVTGVSNTVTAASGVAATTAATAKVAAAPEEVAASVATMAAVKAEAMAYRELAASKFMAAHAYIPFAGAGIAAGFISMMQGLVASVAVTPFANGGIVYGPTLALMGEYAGAKSNPEVIAPLNKLKSLIGNDGSGGGGIYELRVKGRDLVAVLANETRINRKGTNIKI